MVVTAAVLTACTDPPLQSLYTVERGGAFHASLNADGSRVVVSSVADGAMLWRVADGERVHVWSHVEGRENAIIVTAFSVDGRRVVTAERDSVVMWDVDTGRALGSWALAGRVESLALSSHGRVLVAGLRDHTAVVIETRTNRVAHAIQLPSVVNAVAVSADGRFLAAGADDGSFGVWDLSNGTERLSWKFSGGVSAIAIAADARHVYAGRYHGKGRVWNLRNGELVSEIGHDRSSMISARFSADGNRLLTGLPAGRVMLWDVAGGRMLTERAAPRGEFWRPTAMVAVDVAFGGTENELVAVFSSGAVMRWPSH